jgi:hypothetical protein
MVHLNVRHTAATVNRSGDQATSAACGMVSGLGLSLGIMAMFSDGAGGAMSPLRATDLSLFRNGVKRKIDLAGASHRRMD